MPNEKGCCDARELLVRWDWHVDCREFNTDDTLSVTRSSYLRHKGRRTTASPRQVRCFILASCHWPPMLLVDGVNGFSIHGTFLWHGMRVPVLIMLLTRDTVLLGPFAWPAV
jgi:hypothetical protein